jgi:uncharacterized protein YjbI with pentapeptide repeats
LVVLNNRACRIAFAVILAASGVSFFTRWWTHVPWLTAYRWMTIDWRWLGMPMILIAILLLVPWSRKTGDRPRRFPGSALLSDGGIAMAAAVVALLGIGTIISLWQIVSHEAPADNQAALRVDVVKYGIGLMLSGGALAGLLIALRRQHFSEHAHELAERAQAHTERDSEARRVTELYAKGVEQIGSDKAAVRLGGLYALERAAQENPGLRQTVVNVLCAYLRMPYPVKFVYLGDGDSGATPRGLPLVQYDTEPSNERDVARADAQEELQVRSTAQAILLRHLRDFEAAEVPPAERDLYWSAVEIDLSGATLVSWDCSQLRFGGPTFFDGAKFVGPAVFHEVTFDQVAWFNNCHFTEVADFQNVVFKYNASFNSALFADAFFHKIAFGYANFGSTTFNSAIFHETSFKNRAVFDSATFAQSASFQIVRFTGVVNFRRAKFHKTAVFNNVLFGGETFFSDAVLDGNALLDSLTFVEKAWFDGVTLPIHALFRGCAVAKPRAGRVDEWPTGWQASFTDFDEVWGSLEAIKQAKPASG